MSIDKYRLDEITINLDNSRKPLNNIERSKISKKKLYPYYGANNLIDYIDEYIFDEEILCIAEDGGSWGFKEKCSYIVKEKCWVNNHAHVLKAKENLNLRYLNYYLNYTDLNNKITGTTRGKLTKSALNSIEVLLPKLEIQEKIVEVLDKAQELIDKRKAQIEALDELVKSVFYDMFGNPVINSKKWKIKKLNEVVDNIQSGWSPKCDDCSVDKDEWGVLKLSSVTTGKYIETENKRLPIVLEAKEEYLVKNEDLLFTRKNTRELVGACCYVFKTNYNLMIPDIVFRLHTSNLVNKLFIWGLFNCKLFRPNIVALANGSSGSMPNISKSNLFKLNIIVPPIDLQNKFAGIVKNVEKQKELLQKSLTELENNFNSLMQRAFSGELFN